eukprot:scaffold895_cov315-Pinguiococcus_pyrenoidosus.AAC.62
MAAMAGMADLETATAAAAASEATVSSRKVEASGSASSRRELAVCVSKTAFTRPNAASLGQGLLDFILVGDPGARDGIPLHSLGTATSRPPDELRPFAAQPLSCIRERGVESENCRYACASFLSIFARSRIPLPACQYLPLGGRPRGCGSVLAFFGVEPEAAISLCETRSRTSEQIWQFCAEIRGFAPPLLCGITSVPKLDLAPSPLNKSPSFGRSGSMKAVKTKCKVEKSERDSGDEDLRRKEMTFNTNRQPETRGKTANVLWHGHPSWKNAAFHGIGAVPEVFKFGESSPAISLGYTKTTIDYKRFCPRAAILHGQ